VLPISQNKAIVTANAADASARIFIIGQTVEEKAVFERCFEPCMVESVGKRMLFSRRCPKPWSVFFNLPTTGRVPELLPLIAYTLNDDFSVADTLLLSKGWDTGPSFAFDVCTTDDKSIILATVTGLAKKPYLHILQTLNSGKSWSELAIINLDEVPVKVRVGATASRITVACTFQRYDGYHVMAAEFDQELKVLFR
jgi:hypothetical protein